MGLLQRRDSAPVAMDAERGSARGTRRTIPTHLEGVALDMDALVSVHGKPLGRPPAAPIADRPSLPRRGSTSNCFSKRNPRRRRRRSTGTPKTDETDGTEDDDEPQQQHEDEEREEQEHENDTTFFVDDELVPVLANSTVAGDVGPNGRLPYGATNRQRRSTSAPLTASQVMLSSLTASGKHRRRNTDQPAKAKAAKHVTFKNAYEPEIMPDTRAPVQSYDELLFNVAGLYHTLSYLHDADFYDDGATTDSSDSEHSSMQGGPPPPPERSMQLMIAEFLYRSAVYLGYPSDDHVWVPGFRAKKKFSSNDVTRWRRLAHFDWHAEERAFAQEQAEAAGTSRTSSRWTRISTRMSSRTTATYGRDSSTPTGLRTTVSNWFHRGRTNSRIERERSPTAALMPLHQAKHSKPPRPLPKLVLDPPLVSPTADLSLLVEIANSCISYGAFRFTERQLLKLCNVPTRK